MTRRPHPCTITFLHDEKTDAETDSIIVERMALAEEGPNYKLKVFVGEVN